MSCFIRLLTVFILILLTACTGYDPNDPCYTPAGCSDNTEVTSDTSDMSRVPVSNVLAEEIPFEFHTPYQEGVTVVAGGAGSYYEEGHHVGSSQFCVDLNAPDNSGYAVTTAAGGTVVAVGDNDDHHTYYAYDVAIEHEDGYYSTYVHLRSNSVSVGDEVRAGQVIGHEGNEGDSTGSHLHFCIFDASGDSVKPSPMDGQDLEDDDASLEIGRDSGYSFTSNNREVTAAAVTAIKATEAVLYADGLIDHQTEDAHWYGGITALTDSFIIKDWDGGSWGWVGITFDPNNVDQTDAYILRHSFWENYRNNGGPDHFGAPIGDEMDMTRADEYNAYDPYCTGQQGYTEPEQCIEQFCGSTDSYSSVQRFERTTLCWNTDYGYACEAGFNCPEDVDPEIDSTDVEEGPTSTDQYLFIDVNQDGTHDPCVREGSTLYCDQDMDGSHDWIFSIGSSDAEYFSNGTGATVVWPGDDTWYSDTNSDSVTDNVCAVGDGFSEAQRLAWRNTIMVRWNNALYLDTNLDGVTNKVVTWGAGTETYYLADMDGDGDVDLLKQTGNTFSVNTNDDSSTDWSFTYGASDGSDDYYFADIDGDGADDILVRRCQEVCNWFLVLYNSSISRSCPNCSNSNNTDFTYGP